MNEDLLKLLELSYRTSSNQEIRYVTQRLNLLSQEQDYIMHLVQISFNQNIDLNTTCAALAQLKNFVRQNWNSFNPNKTSSIDDWAKHYLQKKIWSLNVELSDNYKYGKIIKDIISFIGGDLLEEAPQVIQNLKTGQQLKNCFNFLLGIVDHFQYTLQPLKSLFFEFLNAMVPAVFQNALRCSEQIQDLMKTNNEETRESLSMNINKYNEIMYLSIKLMKKCLKWCNNLNLRQEAMQWAVVCLKIINNYQQQPKIADLTKREDTAKFTHGSPQFLYLHGRKWAIKYVTDFIKTILIYKASNPDISNSTTAFYDNNWTLMTQTIAQMFNHPSTTKMKAFEFQLLAITFRMKPVLMWEWFLHYQFTVIPQFVYFVEEDRRMAIDSPVQYIIYEEQRCEDENIRKLAAQLWVKILTDNEHYFQKQDVIQKYRLCFHFITQNFQNPDNNHKMLAGYLLEKLLAKMLMGKFKTQFSPDLRQLCTHIVKDLLSSNDFLFIVKGLEVFMVSKDFMDEETCELVGQFILGIFTFNQNDAKNIEGFELIRIKSVACMFYVKQTWFGGLSQVQVEHILSLMLEMMMVYELELIITSFKRFIYNVDGMIKDYIVATTNSLYRMLKNISPQNAQDSSLKKSFFLIMNKTSLNVGIIEVFIHFCYLISSKDKQIKEVLEEVLIFLLEKYYATDPYESNQITQYADYILDFYCHFINEVQLQNMELNKRLWFFYVVIILKIIGLPISALQTIKQLNATPDEKIILANCAHKQEFLLSTYLKILKVYQKMIPMKDHIRKLSWVKANIFQANQIEQLTLMILSFYQRKHEKMSELEYFHQNAKGRIVSTVILLYLLEQHGSNLPIQLFKYTWLIVLNNSRQPFIKKYIRRINEQCFLMWLWNYQTRCITSMDEQRQPLVIDRIQKVLIYLASEKQTARFRYEQIRRIVLGLAGILKIAIIVPKLRQQHSLLIIALLLYFSKASITSQFLYPDYQEEDEYQRRVWVKDELSANNFEKQDSELQYLKNQVENEYRNEPNCVIELNADAFSCFNSEQENFNSQLQEMSSLQTIFDEEYATSLDVIYECRFALEALELFHQHYPETYNKIMSREAYEDDLLFIQNQTQEMQDNEIQQNLFPQLMQHHSNIQIFQIERANMKEMQP